MSNNDDQIPTLGEMIFPGNPEKIAKSNTRHNVRSIPEPITPSIRDAKPPVMPQPETSVQETLANTPRTESRTIKPKPKQSNFENLITARIDNILEKHMEAAREEIVRVVMLELRARLPNSGRGEK